MDNKIPEMVHPLSKYWKQPDRLDVDINNEYATMNRTAFNKLHDYTRSEPSGVYEGKMWKKKINPGGKWFLFWYDESNDPGYCSVKCKEILIIP